MLLPFLQFVSDEAKRVSAAYDDDKGAGAETVDEAEGRIAKVRHACRLMLRGCGMHAEQVVAAAGVKCCCSVGGVTPRALLGIHMHAVHLPPPMGAQAHHRHAVFTRPAFSPLPPLAACVQAETDPSDKGSLDKENKDASAGLEGRGCGAAVVGCTPFPGCSKVQPLGSSSITVCVWEQQPAPRGEGLVNHAPRHGMQSWR